MNTLKYLLAALLLPSLLPRSRRGAAGVGTAEIA